MPESIRDALVSFIKRMQGTAIILVALTWTLVLFSYDPKDPSFNTVSNNGTVHNWLGLFGSHAADLSWQMTGHAGYTLQCAGVMGLLSLRSEAQTDNGSVVALILSIIACAVSLASLSPSSARSSSPWGGAGRQSAEPLGK
jgi:hypothetical protein